MAVGVLGCVAVAACAATDNLDPGSVGGGGADAGNDANGAVDGAADVTPDTRVPACGDGVLDPGEQCDGDELGKKTCSTIPGGFIGGVLGCLPTCAFDTRHCETRRPCGNGVLDDGEDCDGAELDGATCESRGFGGGSLGCTPETCAFDESGCTLCGNDVVDAPEECDGADLGSETCVTRGFAAGELSCAADCAFDETGCTRCGNGTIDGSEECDGSAFGTRTCMTEGAFSGGSLACDGTCQVDTSGCTNSPTCPNGAIDPGEDCDGSNLASKTCVTEGFTGGALACTSGCTFDTSACHECGDGVVQAPEECDGNAFGGATCVTEGFTAGILRCRNACTIDTIGCTRCGNGIPEPGEDCDDGNMIDTDSCTNACRLGGCDPDGTYFLSGPPLSYSCCLGNVNINISNFTLIGDGAVVNSGPTSPVGMTGNSTTCPSGSFSNVGSKTGGCTETYSVSGSFTSANTWTGTYRATFTGSQCSCFGVDPCVNQTWTVTATR